MLHYGEPTISRLQLKKVSEVLKRKYITQGEETKKFEKSLAKKLGCKYCVVVSSGTAALHLAGKSLGWKRGDIIICTPITFVASCNSILFNDASPYFVDVEKYNNNLNPLKLENAIKRFTRLKKKIKAVIVTDLGGTLADWDYLYKLKKKYKFQIINDKCHSIGSKYKGKISYSTDYSEIATLSFHAVKHITTGEGGAILTNNKKIYEKCKLLRSHSIERSNCKSLWSYDIKEIGYNYRLSDFQSILGRYQLKDLSKKIRQRNKVSKFYNAQFSDLKNIETPIEKKENLNANHLYILKVDFLKFRITKKFFFEKALKLGLRLQQHYIPIYKFNYIKKHMLNKKILLPISEIYNKRAISLPIHNNLKMKDLHKVVKIIKKILIDSKKNKFN